MSYDLYFKGKEGKAVNLKEVEGYFTNRPNYAVENGQAFYSNEDTGVYFYFEWNEPGKGDEEIEHELAFNLNYFRPHAFALEAEPEVAKFISKFNLEIDDPQLEGMGTGEYSRDGFFSGWNAGNRFAYQSIAHAPENSQMQLFKLSDKEIERCWTWNFAKSALQSELGESVFVPTMMLAFYQGEVKTLVCWTDAIPIAIPEVDLLLLLRDEIAERKLIFFKNAGIALTTYSSMESILETFPKKEGVLPYRLLSYEKPSEQLIGFFRSQVELKGPPGIIRFDQVLNREMFE